MKKKTLVLTALLSGLAAAPVFAAEGGFNGPDSQSGGGFTGPTTATTNAAQAKTLRDDAWVVLEGHITEKTGKDRYLFRDASGTVDVEIDNHVWQGATVSPQDKVRLEGEVDKDWNSVEIDVKNLKKMP